MIWIFPIPGTLGKLSKARWFCEINLALESDTFWIQKLSLPLTTSGGHLHCLLKFLNLSSKYKIELRFLACLWLGGVMWLILADALWKEKMYVTSRPSCHAGVTLSRDVFFSGTATFVMVAALWPGSLSKMSRTHLLTRYEYATQEKPNISVLSHWDMDVFIITAESSLSELTH